MAGIQISGLVANSPFDWKSVVDQLIAADSIPITNLNATKTTNTQKSDALVTLNTDFVALQTSLQAIRTGNVFAARTVLSDTPNTTWSSASAQGAALGSYTFDVTQLASQARTDGVAGIGSPLSATSSVSGVTLATMNTATAVTAGTFTVNGATVTIATTDSLQDVFTKISTATGGNVTASYTPNSPPSPNGDKITLTSASGNVLLGAANDTSNFIQVMKLANNGTPTATSSATLGRLVNTASLATTGLTTPLTGLDSSGNGAFVINGVTINYNSTTDNFGLLVNRINQSGAGVTASYNSSTDQMSIVNNNTGDIGMGLSDTTGNLLAALGLTSGAGSVFTRGDNAQYTVNGGPPISSMSNTLDSSSHGITGLNVTVNSKTTQTLSVSSDPTSSQAAVQSFITAYNTVQSFIDTNTKITNTGTNVSTSLLSDNREVQAWSSQLRDMAFGAVSGVSGTVKQLNDLGIDFDSTGQLAITDSAKLSTALTNQPNDVSNFFLTPTTGFVGQMYGFLTTLQTNDASQQAVLSNANTSIDSQVAVIQTRLDAERTSLTNAFIVMQDAQSTAQSQSQTLLNAFGNNNNNNSCWVARAVYGAHDPRWLLFRFWMLHQSPGWFRRLYLRHGARVAAWLENKPCLKAVVRCWMDTRIANLRDS
jgi:flagellar hook-associated protein 2